MQLIKNKKAALDTLFETGEDLHILIMNVEALSTKKGVDFATKIFIFSQSFNGYR